MNKILMQAKSFTSQIATISNPDFSLMIGCQAVTQVGQNCLCTLALNSGRVGITLVKEMPEAVLVQWLLN